MLDLIVNPKARRGLGVAEVEKAAAYFDAQKIGYTLHYTEYRKHATELAYRLTMDGADTIVSCGGDGTIHEIINGIIKARLELESSGCELVTKLALLPCGTGNDFMRSAGMSIDTLTAAQTVISGTDGYVDAINIDGVYEICFACHGIDVDVVSMVNASKRKTKSSYLKKILLCIFKRINYNFRVIIDGKEYNERGVVVAVVNGAQLASGMKFCPKADVADGYLDVVIIRKRAILPMLYHLAKMTGANFIDGKTVLHFKAKEAAIFVEQKQIDIDGELFENKKFDAKIAPNMIMLIR